MSPSPVDLDPAATTPVRPEVLEAMLPDLTEQAFGNALGAAVQSRRTTVIGVRIDASGYVAQFNALREL